MVQRLAWPHVADQDSIYRWRSLILFSIMFAGMILGIITFIPVVALVFEIHAWGLAIVDIIAVPAGLVIIFSRHIKFEVRALISCLVFYVIGMSVILSVGVLSGGPAWLFTFAVLSGILLGSRAALYALVLNMVSLISIGLMVSGGKIGAGFPFFNTPQAMVAAGANFLFLNSVTAISVSALLKGLTDSEKRYRLMADNAGDLIWTMDMDLNFTYVSPSVYQMQGYTSDEILTAPLDEIMTPESLRRIMQIYNLGLENIKTGNPKGWNSVTFQAEQFCKDGSKIWTSINTKFLRGPDGRPEGILGVTRDITEQKKSEQDKINAQMIAEENRKLALIGQVAGKMAHDFNNVLGIVMGQSELALLSCSDPETKKAFELILDQTIRGKNLTKNLIAFANRSEPRQEFFLLSEKIDFVFNLIRDDLEGIRVINENPEHIELLADPGMIEHALVNLVQNSVHALSLTADPWIAVRSSLHEEHVILEIEDNGCGIPEKDLKNIFEPSFTLKGSRDKNGDYKPGIKGTGYGLSNVKKYISQHKGEISIFSKQDTGTRVTISLPVVKKELTGEEKTKIQEIENHINKKILLVEDEEAIAQVQYTILTKAPFGHKVDVASNGEDAIALFNKNHYDLISLDYILPGDINGKDIYDHIRKKDPSVPVLFVSGNIEFLESIENIKQEDPRIGHLSKPCRNIEYAESMNRMLES